MHEKIYLSRRSFVKGMQAATLVPLVGVTGCSLFQDNTFCGDSLPLGCVPQLYSDLLKQWCDGMLAHQMSKPSDLLIHGGLDCPVCKRIHGRCADSLYPFMHMARATGESKYLDAAIHVQAWSDNMTQPDGSWLNDAGATWKGITVFGAIALCDALHYHGVLLDKKTQRRWTDRLAQAMKFLDGFMTMKTGNINYPVTSSLAFTLAGEILSDARYTARGREFAHASLKNFTPNHFLFGEGKPQDGITAKGARPVDLGYNVEESLPALALYALETGDKEVMEQVVKALRTHAEFMLPDGAWDNSWGSRNYKWTWWGSRTSDGCQPAYALLADKDPCFREVASRNLKLFASCTHDGLLYGGPHYYAHGDKPCIHHTFTHAKALACVLDHTGRATFSERAGGVVGDHRPTPTKIYTLQDSSLPRQKEYGLKSYPEIGVSLVSIGPWRATLTEYDWEYTIGGQASGGTLSMLYHTKMGPLLSASMTEYRGVEKHNQQDHGNYPTMCLTPRVEYKDSEGTYTSLSDLKATFNVSQKEGDIHAVANGFLQAPKHKKPTAGEIPYHLTYRISKEDVEISASVPIRVSHRAEWIVPIVCTAKETVKKLDSQTLQIQKATGIIEVKTNAPEGFAQIKDTDRVFNVVPGLECLPLRLQLPTDGSNVNLSFTTRNLS